MSDEAIFGPIIDGDDVEAALLAHLRTWMPTYLAATRRRKDPTETRWPSGIAPVRSFTVTHAGPEKWPEDQLPMLLAYAPGFAQPPTRDGDGTVSATYACTLTAIVSGYDMADSKTLGRLYAQAAMMAILQKPTLGGFARETQLVDLNNFPVTRGVEAERNLMAVAGVYVIDVDGILNDNAGPAQPTEDVPDGPPAVHTSHATVDLL